MGKSPTSISGLYVRRRRMPKRWDYALALFVGLHALPFACRDFDPIPEPGGGGGALGGGGVGTNEMGGSAATLSGMGGQAAGPPGGTQTSGGDSGGAGEGTGAGGADSAAGAGGASAGTQTGGSDTGGAGGQATALPPSSFPQLVLWLEATNETCTVDEDQTVSHWVDLSSASNDASTRDGFLQPEYVEAVANGHDALRFEPVAVANKPDDPTALEVSDSASLDFGTGDFAYLLVMRWSNSTLPTPGYLGSGAIIAKQSIKPGFPGVLLLANYPAFFADVPASTRLAVQLELGGAFVVSRTDGFAGDDFRLYVARRVGTEFSLRVNGEHENGSRISPDLDLGATDAPLLLGGNSGMPLRGDIAELVALRGSTSDVDFAALEAGLMDKYGLR